MAQGVSVSITHTPNYLIMQESKSSSDFSCAPLTLSTQMHSSVHTHSEKKPECSICFLQPNKFGLLKNCNHIFCAPCIEEWRKRDLRCPICRKTSEKVFPHINYLTGKAKINMISEDEIITTIYYKYKNPCLRTLIDNLNNYNNLNNNNNIIISERSDA